MSGDGGNLARQFAAAWEAAAAVVAEWAERTAAVTADAARKLTSDPAIRAVLESWRTLAVWFPRACGCDCSRAHPGDPGVCDHRAVITRRAGKDADGDVVALCAPCAVAQAVAELPP